MQRYSVTSMHYYITDFEMPFIELIFRNISGMARVFITNAILNGLAILTFLCFYIWHVSKAPKSAIYFKENSKALHELEVANQVFALWPLINVTLCFLELVSSIIMMQLITSRNYKILAVFMHVYKSLTWGLTVWVLWFFLKEEEGIKEYFSDTLTTIIKLMILHRLLLFATFIALTLAFSVTLCLLAV